MGNAASKCSREDDGDGTGGPGVSSLSSVWHVRHGLDKHLSLRHKHLSLRHTDDPNLWKAMFRRAMELFEQSEEEEAETMKEYMMMFRRALMNAALRGRMSYEDECLLMEWANHRGRRVTKEMEVFLNIWPYTARHGWGLTMEKATFHNRLRCLGRYGMLDEDEMYWTGFAEHLHEDLGLRSLAAELERFVRDAARTPPDTSCCESSSDPTNQFCESFHHSLVVSW